MSGGPWSWIEVSETDGRCDRWQGLAGHQYLGTGLLTRSSAISIFRVCSAETRMCVNKFDRFIPTEEFPETDISFRSPRKISVLELPSALK